MKGVSPTRKRMFRVLCVVLALALLASNVFAATPTPEVPLADEATVTRVKNEITTGEITDMEDVFLVAYQNLGADLEEDGMTAYINEDGTLGFTQIISSEKKLTRSGDDVEEKTIALTTIAMFDKEANLLSDYDYYYNHWELYDTGDMNTVYATHIMYVNARVGGIFALEVQLDYMVTVLSHTSHTLASKLVQLYQGRADAYTITDNASRTLNNPGSSTYTFTPSSRTWYNPTTGSEGGGLYTASEVFVANTDQSFVIGRSLLFDDNYINYDELFPQ